MPAYIFAVLICIYTVITMKTRCSFTKFKGLLLTFLFLFQWFALKQKMSEVKIILVHSLDEVSTAEKCTDLFSLCINTLESNLLCLHFKLQNTFKHTRTHTHADTRRHTIFSAQRSCSVHRWKVDGHEWESTSVTGEVSEGGLWFFFFGGGANVCNLAKRRRQLKQSITLTCAFCKRTRLMLVCFLAVNKPHDGPSLLTSLRTHLCPHKKKKQQLLKQSSNKGFFL